MTNYLDQGLIYAIYYNEFKTSSIAKI